MIEDSFREQLNRSFRFKKVTCHRCGKEWIYKGKNSYKVSCPSCKTSVVLKKKGEKGRH